jgi:hypothetical protein
VDCWIRGVIGIRIAPLPGARQHVSDARDGVGRLRLVGLEVIFAGKVPVNRFFYFGFTIDANGCLTPDRNPGTPTGRNGQLRSMKLVVNLRLLLVVLLLGGPIMG